MAEEKEEKKPDEEKESSEKEEEEKPKEGEEEEEEEEILPKLGEAEEPKTRFTQKEEEKKEQTPQEKREGFLFRKLEKIEKALGIEGEAEPAEPKTEDIERVIDSKIEEKVSRIEKSQSSEMLLQDFLAQYPDYKPYSSKIRKHMNHPAYENVPIGFIADGIVGQDLQAMGAKKSKEAEEEAEETKGGGSSRRATPGKKIDVWKMSKKEFQQYQNEVLQSKRE